MWVVRTSNTPVVTGISDLTQSRVRHHCMLYYIFLFDFVSRILPEKQYLQGKFKYKQKVWIAKFFKSMYENQYFLKVLVILIDF